MTFTQPYPPDRIFHLLAFVILLKLSRCIEIEFPGLRLPLCSLNIVGLEAYVKRIKIKQGYKLFGIFTIWLLVASGPGARCKEAEGSIYIYIYIYIMCIYVIIYIYIYIYISTEKLLVGAYGASAASGSSGGPTSCGPCSRSGLGHFSA